MKRDRGFKETFAFIGTCISTATKEKAQHRRSLSVGKVSILCFAIALWQGCTLTSLPYRERHEIKQLTVVFLDEDSLHQEWKNRTGRQPIVLGQLMRNGLPLVKTLRGFYDFPSNTLYCPKWNFEVCGHELHHAVLGQFHND
jgi:hypothetical protein